MDNEQEIRRVLAGFMGWHEDGDLGWGNNGLFTLDEPPDYLHDLNAMFDVERQLQGRGLEDKYLDALGPIVEPEYYGPLDIDLWLMVSSTAEQRARAAYQVISRQKEG